MSGPRNKSLQPTPLIRAHGVPKRRAYNMSHAIVNWFHLRSKLGPRVFDWRRQIGFALDHDGFSVRRVPSFHFGGVSRVGRICFKTKRYKIITKREQIESFRKLTMKNTAGYVSNTIRGAA